MSKAISFTLEQVEALKQLAAARPRFWEDAVRKALSEGPDGIESMLTYLTNHRRSLKQWRSILPEEHSMSLYVPPGFDQDKGSILFSDVREIDGVETKVLDHIEFEGYDPEKWLISAVKNLDLLLRLVDELIAELTSHDPVAPRPSKVPLSVVESNVKTIALIEDHFQNLKADEIYKIWILYTPDSHLGC